MRKFYQLFGSIFFLIINYAESQTPTPLQLKDYDQTYWNYRDKFKKHFIKIGDGFGEGLTMSHLKDDCNGDNLGIDPSFCGGSGSSPISNCSGSEVPYYNWDGEGGSDYEYSYIAVLATE